MNGLHPSTSINFGNQYLTTTNDPSLSFLSNPMGLSFFGNSNSKTLNTSNLNRSDPVSDSAAANVNSRFASSNVRQINLDRMWGIGEDNTIIDDDQEREASHQQSWEGQPEENEAPDEEEIAQDTSGVTEDIEVAEGIAEGAEVASSATPWGLLALLNTQLGQSLNSAMVAGQQNTSSQDFQNNMNQHGVNVALNASLIQQQQQQTIRADEAGGAIGSLFGPLGTLIGHAVAGTVQANPGIFNTAGSSSGWINPTNVVAANSASAETASDQTTMQDNVD